MPHPRLGHTALVLLLAALGAWALLIISASRPDAWQHQGPTSRPTAITASRYKFDPARIEVFQGDLVKIELRTADIAHSFTIDEYRIAKRVNPGSLVIFEFRVDRIGTFSFYCDLHTEDGCRQMRGELIVKPRK
jgi:heme/copper-type cytochrome/quinol oxidase subunit 2